MLGCSKLSSAPCTQKQCQSGALLNVPRRQYSRNVRNATALIRRAAVAADTAEVTAVVHPVYPRLPAPEAAHFEADNTVFVEEFRIRGNEAGPDQRANIITIANLLQVCMSPSS
jgi:fatty acyl-ACP thioesterase A